MLSSLLNSLCLRSHQWLYQKAHQQYKPGKKRQRVIYQKNAPRNRAAVLHHAAARSAGYESFAQKALLKRPQVDPYVKHETLDPKKLSKALVGLRLKCRINITRLVWGTEAGSSMWWIFGALWPVQSQHLPWSGGSCTGQWAACSHGQCQALKHRKWGACYSASQKVTDVHLHSTEHSCCSCPLDRAPSP